MTPPDWPRQRDEMVRATIEGRGVRDPRVLAAMRAVPREAFVPGPYRRRTYDDGPLPIGRGQTISQPYIVALTCEAARVSAADRVLEIGAGCGYQTAVLAELAGPAGEVYGIELEEALAADARERLATLGYAQAQLRVGDGWHGWPEYAPYDAIVVACAAPAVPPALVAQLAPGGHLVIPVGPPGGIQSLDVIAKRTDGTTLRRALCDVRFVPLRR